MKVAVFSDIHSNHLALKKCIQYIDNEKIDKVILLGDYVSDCPNPQKTLSLIKQIYDKYEVWCVRGNREEYFIRHDDKYQDNWVYEANTGSLLYTYENLTNADLMWFRSLKNTEIVQIDQTEPIIIAHASLTNSRELLYENEQNTKDLLDSIQYRYMLCGHTHRQFKFTYKDKMLINPGSVGVPIGCKESAHMAILHWVNNKWDVEFHTIPYDFEQLKKEFKESEMTKKANLWMKCIIRSIEEGINYAPLCVKRAYDIAKHDLEEVDWNHIPASYWNQAAKELRIL